MISQVDVLSYYDGIMSGKLTEGDKLYYFQLSQESSMYPDDGRTYDVWLVDDDITDANAEYAWWDLGGRPAERTISELELLEAENISY